MSKTISEKTDLELITEFRENGNVKSFTEIVNRHTSSVFYLCQRFLSEEDSRDATLEIFEKLFFLLKQHKIANFRSWLHVVSKNHCLMIKRQVERQGLYLFDPTEFENIAAECKPYDNNENSDLFVDPDKVNKAVNQLKEPQRICIQYFYFLNKSYKEISDITGFDKHQVKSYIQNGKRNLKNILLRNYKARNE